MQCPTLTDLPAPPPGRTGWPWTEESSRLPIRGPEGDSWPCVSVITPSFNQGEFIEETIRSILLQGYPNLEYFVMDGGSTDASVGIIQKYSQWLTHWISERDNGQSDAINRGMTMASSDFATWINSDDMLCKNALAEQASLNGFSANTVYVGNCFYIDETGKVLSLHKGKVQCLEDLVRVKTVWRAGGQIVQPEVIFPRELYLAVGGLDSDNHFTMDFDLWGKFFLAGAKFCYTDVDFAMFRRHSNQKTQDALALTRSLVESAKKLIYQAASLPAEAKRKILADLDGYQDAYPHQYWRSTGRLARIGLPRPIVTVVRSLNATIHKNARMLFGISREEV
jgi:glycosyltransferase involved in cell wall biosynthesis